MQQLIITFMAVTGMIVPVAAGKLERFLLALVQADGVAPQAVTSLAADARGARVARITTPPVGALRSVHFPQAGFWRDRDVDIPRQLTRSCTAEHQKARLAGSAVQSKAGRLFFCL